MSIIQRSLIPSYGYCPVCKFLINESDDIVVLSICTYHKDCWESFQRKPFAKGRPRKTTEKMIKKFTTNMTRKERYNNDPAFRDRKLSRERELYHIRNQNNPDRRKILTAKIMLRYYNDPEYRAMRQAKNRQYYNKKRLAKNKVANKNV